MLSCDTNHRLFVTRILLYRDVKSSPLLVQDTRQSEGFQGSVVSSPFLLGVNITCLFSEITSSQSDHRIMSLPFFLSPISRLCQVKIDQLCLTYCDPMTYSPPSSSVHGILQARVLEWVAIPFSRGSFKPRD